MRKIDPKNWFLIRKRACKVHPFILDLMYYYSTTPQMIKIYNAKPIEPIEILEGDWTAASVKLSQLKNFGKKIIKKIQDDPKFTSFLISKSQKISKKMRKNLEFLKKEKLVKLSNKKILEIYFKLVENYRKFCFFSFPLWIFGGEALFQEMKKILNKKKVSKENFNKYLTLLITPLTPSFIFQEELEVLKLSYNLKKLKKDDIFKKIKKITKKFGFMIYDYRGPKVKKEKDYFKEIKKFSKKYNLTEELKEKLNFYRKLREDQIKLLKKLKFNQKEKNIILAVQHATTLQDIRKYYNSYFNFKTEVLIKEMARRLKIPFQLVRYILPHEMKKIWRDQKVDKKILEERTKLCVFNIKNGKSKIYLGKEATPFLVLKEEKIKKTKIIKGISASVGRVFGKIRIIRNKEEVKNLKKGEILVTPMTMPDFAPAFKKCIAIITDEGGITCHAAIVSRELGIPCVIGTKIATKVLKDGDLVEVDADKGIIKLLRSGLDS
ncbi:MAG: PEP-utilizing enzyme [Patescibacteria group bacterium]